MYKKNDFKKAFEYHKLFYLYQDSLLNERIAKQISEISEQYESGKRILQIKTLEQEKIIQDNKINQQKNIIYFSIVSIMLMLIAIIFISKNYTEKKKYNHLLAQKNKEITDNIIYAKRIQQAILPLNNVFDNIFRDYFILFRPKDIVSGDFYWLKEKNDKKLIVVSDCTGHGVSGAFMSLIGHSLLNKIVNEYNIINPSIILKELSKGINQYFDNNDDQSKVNDGMDISICCFDKRNMTIEYSGAYNPLYFVRQNKIEIIKPDKIAIGNYIENINYTLHKINVIPEDKFYMFSDGYADQFGGDKNKKFKYKELQKLLLSITDKTMFRQKEILNTAFNNWKGNLEQTDDVLIIGFKI